MTIDDKQKDTYDTWFVRKEALSKLRIHDDVIKWKYFPPYWPFVR